MLGWAFFMVAKAEQERWFNLWRSEQNAVHHSAVLKEHCLLVSMIVLGVFFFNPGLKCLLVQQARRGCAASTAPSLSEREVEILFPDFFPSLAFNEIIYQTPIQSPEGFYNRISPWWCSCLVQPACVTVDINTEMLAFKRRNLIHAVFKQKWLRRFRRQTLDG